MAVLTTIVQQGKNGGESATFTICPTDVYPQTLFLGCSIKSFNTSLAWGAESSRLSVELVYDPCGYPFLININNETVKRPTAADDFTTKLINNTFEKDENGNSIVPGKVYYVPDLSKQKLVSYYYYEKDPGFYADMDDPSKSIDIIGCPVYFKYNSFEFYGIVKNWEKKIDNSSVKSYSVTIEAPTSLLSQTQVILSDYVGGIAVKDPTLGKYFPSHKFSDYNGKIKDQVIHNIVNVYGYLEDNTDLKTNLPLDINTIDPSDPDSGDPTYLFGRSGRTEEGIRANLIVLAIGELLGYTRPFDYKKILRYAPLGRMVGPCIKNKIDSTDPIAVSYPDGVLMGLILPIEDPVKEKRSLYAINLSELVNIVPDYYRISDTNINVLDLINKICADAGRELFVEMVLSIETTGVYPIIRIRTIDRLAQPASDAVETFLEELQSNKKYIVSYTKGEEYNNNRIRSMYIGGKQQRLYQVKNTKYAYRQSTLRWNAYLQTFTAIDHNIKQQYRIPNPSSTRNPAFYDQETQGSLFARLQFPKGGDTIEVFQNPIERGNYFPLVEVAQIGVIPMEQGAPGSISAPGEIDKNGFPASDTDAICPYFGENDFTKVVRKVYRDSRGFFVEFSTTELAAAMGISAQAATTVWVSETEIRAAMAGLDQYVGFISAVLDDYFFMMKSRPELSQMSIIDTWTKVLQPIFKDQYPISMNMGILKTYNAANNSQPGSKTVPNGPSSSFMSENLAFNTISKLQNYLKRIGDQHYGKSYMISVPVPAYWTDSVDYIPIVKEREDPDGRPIFGSGEKIEIAKDLDNNPIWMKTGTQKTYFSVEPADSAWEEYGNNIDDNIKVGELGLFSLLEENGSIPPILGFNNNPQYNYAKNFSRQFWTQRRNQTNPGAEDYPNDKKNPKAEGFAGGGGFGGGGGAAARRIIGNGANVNNAVPEIDGKKPTTDDHFQFWKYDAYKRSSVPFGKYYPDNWILDAGDHCWEQSLVLSDNADNVFIKPYVPLSVPGQPQSQPTDAFGKFVPYELISKAYVKGTMKKELGYYLTKAGKVSAKLIVSIDPVFINPMTPGALSVNAAATEFLTAFYLGDDAARAAKVLALCDVYDPITPLIPNANAQDIANKQFKNMGIAPKAAIPFFAALPVILNGYVYGPWINAPDLQKKNIFGLTPSAVKAKINVLKERKKKLEDLADATPDTNEQQSLQNKIIAIDKEIQALNNVEGLADKKLENLVGGVKIEINPEFVPWNYGSMAILDEAMRLLVGQDNEYQTKSENGQITIYGIPDKKLGDELKASNYSLKGPTITSINMQITEAGPSTTYTFRTFTRKFTLYNKDSADRLKNSAMSSLKLQKEIRQNMKEISTKLKSMSNIASLPLTNRALNTNSKLTMYSPMSVLVGYSNPYVSPKASGPVSFYSGGMWSKDSVRQASTVTLQDYRELSQEFDTLYSAKSIMSLDGLLSPVSFYPTINSSTAPYKKYSKKFCPFCAGTKHFQLKEISYYCNYCEEDTVSPSYDNTKSSNMVPYIIASGDDNTIIKNLPLVQNLVLNKAIGKIDYKNLNPIIMPVGEFRNTFAQSGDYNAHHIDIVARGMVPMLGSISESDNLAIDQNGLEFFDVNNIDSQYDHNSMAFDSEAQLQEIVTTTNFRFLGLRGPLVMAGWGYDIQGYPIPNASGEPLEMDEFGNPKKIKDLSDTEGSFDPDYEGTIVGKNQVIGEDGKWTPPMRENTFLKGWGLRPDLWPMGPIDLRWDSNRRVWVAPPLDIFIDIQLEDDLVPPYPARGFLNDMDRASPLPSGLRRMVFVKDPSNQYGAPRGAKLFCRYNYGNGFYEPVVRTNITVTGLILSSNTAKVQFIFERGSLEYTEQPITPDPITVQYQNPLEFNVSPDQYGIFTYFNSGWILTSAKGC